MKNRLLLFTGDGKGKTTAALGMVLRASGHGQRALVVQFMKTDSRTGELAALQQLPGVKIMQTGCGFVPPEQHAAFPKHRAAAEGALALAQQALASGDWELLVMDEICGAVASHLLPEAAVLELMQTPTPTAVLVLTGRGATPSMIELADTVTEMRCLKHGYASGIKAQAGVEF